MLLLIYDITQSPHVNTDWGGESLSDVSEPNAVILEDIVRPFQGQAESWNIQKRPIEAIHAGTGVENVEEWTLPSVPTHQPALDQ